ncbi:hypothetical protein ACE10Z_33715 [Bradyrhizobium sp. Pha-3]|uniref:hypothetical protein n=1 Tax=Bradyrhizobium sp. Pha-3 TaxID=208375 RepID=UPI0035D51C72
MTSRQAAIARGAWEAHPRAQGHLTASDQSSADQFRFYSDPRRRDYRGRHGGDIGADYLEYAHKKIRDFWHLNLARNLVIKGNDFPYKSAKALI